MDEELFSPSKIGLEIGRVMRPAERDHDFVLLFAFPHLHPQMRAGHIAAQLTGKVPERRDLFPHHPRLLQHSLGIDAVARVVAPAVTRGSRSYWYAEMLAQTNGYSS